MRGSRTDGGVAGTGGRWPVGGVAGDVAGAGGRWPGGLAVVGPVAGVLAVARPAGGPAVAVHRSVQPRMSRQYQRTSAQPLPPSGTSCAVGRAMPHSQQRSTWSCRWWARSGCLGPAMPFHLRAACRAPGQPQARASAAGRLARQPLVLSLARHRPAGRRFTRSPWPHRPPPMTFSRLVSQLLGA